MHELVVMPINVCAVQIKVHSGRVVSLGIWDTAGAERFESLSRMYYNGAKAAILCFDPCNAKSFEKMKFWVRRYSSASLAFSVHAATHEERPTFCQSHPDIQSTSHILDPLGLVCRLKR